MIIVTGTIAWDYLMEFPGKFGDHILPEHIHNVNLSFIVDKYAKRRGGTAGNVSYTMGLLKTPHILYSAAGNDFRDYKKAFQKLHIDTRFIYINKKESTATGFAMTDTTNNQIWGYYYGAAICNETLALKKVIHSTHSSRSGSKDMVLIGPQGAKGSMHFVDECIALGIDYMFDPGFILTQVSGADLTRGIVHAKYIIGNEYEMELIAKRVNDWENVKKGKVIMTTRGERGALIEDGLKHYCIPVVAVKKVASTAGAGDAWRGGFLAGLERGLDLQTCGQIGAVASSFSVEHFGTQEHGFTLKEFSKRYRQNFGSLVEL